MQLRAINKTLVQHYDQAVKEVYNNATKLAATVEVDARFNSIVKADDSLTGALLKYLFEEPTRLGSLKNPADIRSGHVEAVRRSTKIALTEYQQSFMSPGEVKELVEREVIMKYGYRVIPVSGPSPRMMRSKWPYLRYFRHAQPSDIHDAVKERDVGISLDRDARNILTLLSNAAKYADPRLFEKNASLERIFQA